MQRSTLERIASFSGRGFIGWPGRDITLSIRPNWEGGLQWNVNGRSISLTTENMMHTHQRGKDEVKRITHQSIEHEGMQLRVPEHFISALYLKGISDAVISINRAVPQLFSYFLKTKKVYTPPVGDGSMFTYYSKLNPVRTFERDLSDWKVIRKDRARGTYGEVIVAPSDSLKVIVDAWKDDPYKVSPDQFLCDDVYGEKNPALLSARGILGLIPTPFVYTLTSPMRWAVSGVTKENYVARYAPESMKSIFQEGRNEHSAHLVFSDFPSELYSAFGGRVYGSFRMEKGGGGHKGRLLALSALKERESIIEAK